MVKMLLCWKIELISASYVVLLCSDEICETMIAISKESELVRSHFFLKVVRRPYNVACTIGGICEPENTSCEVL